MQKSAQTICKYLKKCVTLYDFCYKQARKVIITTECLRFLTYKRTSMHAHG